MAQSDQHQHHVHRVVLPSGKSVDVVYFEDRLPEHLGAANLEPIPEKGLHVCKRCDSKLVYPLAWDEASATEWKVTLRCPDCEWQATSVYKQDVVERFDSILDRGTEALVNDLKRLSVANMEEAIDRFAGALDADQILPEDF